jgi:hypothetical protein
MSEVTSIAPLDSPADGYIIIAPLDERIKTALTGVQNKIAEVIPRSTLWLPEDDQLHVTFAHIISPDAKYAESTQSLFTRVGSTAISALGEIVPNDLDIPILFDKIEAFPGSIVVMGRDDGSMQQLRTAFGARFKRPEGTRPAPEIIHTTIARFREEMDLDIVRKCVAGLSVSFEGHITQLQLIHEQKIFVQEHEILQTYPQ